MTYLPHIEKASSAARNVSEPLANALEQIGTLRGLFLGNCGGSQVAIESAKRHAVRARYWLNTAIEELDAAEAGMPDPVKRPEFELTPAGYQALGEAEGESARVIGFPSGQRRTAPLDHDPGPSAA